MLTHKEVTQWYQQWHPQHDLFYNFDRDCWAVPEGEKIALYHQMKRLAEVGSDETWIFCWEKRISTSDAVRLSSATGITVGLDASQHRNKKQTVRVYAENATDIPFTPGMRVRDKKVLEPHKYVDEVRRTNLQRGREVRAKYLDPVVKLAKSLVRLDGVDWQKLKYTHEFPEGLLIATNHGHQEAELFLGWALARVQWWLKDNDSTRFDPMHDVQRYVKELQRRLYEHHGVYYYEKKGD